MARAQSGQVGRSTKGVSGRQRWSPTYTSCNATYVDGSMSSQPPNERNQLQRGTGLPQRQPLLLGELPLSDDLVLSELGSDVDLKVAVGFDLVALNFASDRSSLHEDFDAEMREPEEVVYARRGSNVVRHEYNLG